MAGPELAARFRTLKASATVEMSDRVRAARAAGRDIIALSSGDPNIATDSRIIEAAHCAMLKGATRYTSAFGEPSLREAVAVRELERANATYDPNDVIITPGGKFAVLTALMAIVEGGDEVIVPQPGWVSYGPCIKLAGGTPVPVDMLDRFDVGLLEHAITPKTRAMIINSPVNPTGQVLSRAQIKRIVEIAEARNLWIIFDQVYADMLYHGEMSYPQSLAAGHARTLVCDSLSKSFGMTGWRLGYLALPAGLAKFVVKFLQHSVYCVPPFVQEAGVRALELRSELLPGYRELFRGRVTRGADVLDRVDGIDCVAPAAGFFLFPRVDGDEVAVARRWLDTLGVAVLPGSAFGAAGAGHLRLSLSCSDADLDRALERIALAGLAS